MIQIYDYNDDDLIVINLTDIDTEEQYVDILASIEDEVLTLLEGDYNQLGQIVTEKEKDADYYKYISEYSMTSKQWKERLKLWHSTLI